MVERSDVCQSKKETHRPQCLMLGEMVNADHETVPGTAAGRALLWIARLSFGHVPEEARPFHLFGTILYLGGSERQSLRISLLRNEVLGP